MAGADPIPAYQAQASENSPAQVSEQGIYSADNFLQASTPSDTSSSSTPAGSTAAPLEPAALDSALNASTFSGSPSAEAESEGVQWPDDLSEDEFMPRGEQNNAGSGPKKPPPKPTGK